jgi:hypothetical protein
MLPARHGSPIVVSGQTHDRLALSGMASARTIPGRSTRIYGQRDHCNLWHMQPTECPAPIGFDSRGVRTQGGEGSSLR